MHPLLARQLRRLGLDPESPPTGDQWKTVLERVAQTYGQADQDRYMLERSLQTSSEEMQQLYGDLQERSAQEIGQKAAELEKSLALAHSIQDSVADGILVCDLQGTVLACNRRFLEMWAIPQEVIATRSLPAYIGYCEKLVKDADALKTRARDYFGDGLRHIDHGDLELVDGRIFERWAGPVGKGDGTIIGRIVCHRDVSEQRRLAAQRVVVSERMASVGQLVASVAHEINNPLAYIAGNVDVVCRALGDRGDPRDESFVEALEDARLGVSRIEVIVRDLRTLSRVDDDNRASVDIAEVVETALQMANNQIRHRARIVRRFESRPRVLANEARLTQVFLNLLLNATHAIPEGRANDHAITIGIQVGPTGRALVDVQDTGSGIAPAHLERIFDPFFTTKPLGAGTGLGLSICKGIIEKLGGTITVTSVLGRGTSFIVELPVASDAPAPRRAETVQPPSVTRRRVLVIDDDPHVRRWLERALRRDHDVVMAASVAEATAAIDGPAFDVILCDLMMPDRTGRDMHEIVKQRRPELADKIVFMSGGVFTPALESFLASVSNARIEKPVALRELRDTIERVAASR
jgi:signal transduction histidine kinase